MACVPSPPLRYVNPTTTWLWTFVPGACRMRRGVWAEDQPRPGMQTGLYSRAGEGERQDRFLLSPLGE